MIEKIGKVGGAGGGGGYCIAVVDLKTSVGFAVVVKLR